MPVCFNFQISIPLPLLNIHLCAVLEKIQRTEKTTLLCEYYLISL